MRLPGFVGPSYESYSKILAGERSINLFKENVATDQGKARSGLVSAPGLVTFATVDDTPGRGLFHEDGRLFGVFGETLYEFTSAGVETALGTVIEDDNPAQMTTNGDGGNELHIVSGDSGYIFDLVSSAFTTEVTDVTMCGQIDGFFVDLDANSSTIKISESLDGLTWDATQIAQRTAASDPWIAMLISRREIYLFGGKTGEVWFNAGNSPFPFAQRPGAFFEIGIAARFSLCRFGSTMAWLGESAQGAGVVYWMNGYTPNPISNPAVEKVIQTYRDDGGISDAIAWSYEREGHQFYVLTFPTQGKTWVYDAATGEWHERGRWNSLENAFVAYRPQFHANAFGKNLVCDNQSGTIYELSSTTYTDVGGSVLRRERRTPHLSDENRRLFFDYFELECERGVGLASATVQGYDPLVALRYSDDGGQTFGAERTRSLGKRGVHDQRVRWDCCGSGRDRVWSVSCSEPVPFHIFDAYVGVS